MAYIVVEINNNEKSCGECRFLGKRGLNFGIQYPYCEMFKVLLPFEEKRKERLYSRCEKCIYAQRLAGTATIIPTDSSRISGADNQVFG